VLLQGIVEPIQGGASGVPTNAGIDDMVIVLLIDQALLQKGYPAFFGIDSPRSTDTITEHQNCRRSCPGMAGD